MRPSFPWLFSLLILSSSCSTYRLINHHVQSKFSKAGLHQKVIKTGAYQIDYWDNETDKPVIVLVHVFGATASFQWLRPWSDHRWAEP